MPADQYPSISPAAPFTFTPCKSAYLYSSDDQRSVVSVFFAENNTEVNTECLLQSKMMNSGRELQRKQQVVWPTSALLNLNKSPAGGVFCSCYSPYRGRLRLKVKGCPSSYHTTICHVYLSFGSFKDVHQGHLQISVKL